MGKQSKSGTANWEEEFLAYLFNQMVLADDQLKKINQLLSAGKNLQDLLREFLTPEEILEHKSRYFGIEKICLNHEPVDKAAAHSITEDLARKHGIVPVAIRKGVLFLAMADPTNSRALDDVRFYTGFQAQPLLADEEEIKIAIREYFTIQSADNEAAGRKWDALNRWKVGDEADLGQEAPVIRLVDSLFRQAILEKASDIHWEPKDDRFLVRFRIDGRLEERTVLPAEMDRSIAARLKVMAGMDITERRIPQDGRIMLEQPDKKIDIRVSSFPTVCGEKIVTRILDDQTARRSLSELGMRRDVEEGVRNLLRQPHGLILISGPTGSGKTTSLYAFVREIQSESLNIVSIEDPVEYRLPGVNQAQVNTKIGFDFAGGLRAILRQDPDIIMVGEIRDKETAHIATAAALTGHLVLTTVHTNTAAEALARLLDMEIEPYLVASAVCGVIAQRLVRKLCPACRQKAAVSPEVRAAFGLQDIEFVYRPQGCGKCRSTGYAGRIGIHEYLPYNPQIKEMVMRKCNASQIEKTSRGLGMLTLWEDALGKVRDGTTSLEEVIRLVYQKV